MIIAGTAQSGSPPEQVLGYAVAMPRQTAELASIQIATTELHVAAVRLLLADEPQSELLARAAAVLKTVRRNGQQCDQMLVALRGGALVGSIWGQMTPGRTAVIWPPRITADEPDQTADGLLRELELRLQRSGVDLVQAVLKHAGNADSQRLERFGFVHSVELLYLLSERVPGPNLPQPGPLTFVSYTTDQQLRMAQLLEATYEGSLDVPQLNGVREMSDVLDGYEQTGDADSSRWFFVEHEGSNVGCLLLARHAEQGQWELVYMGLTPPARGYGWGQVIVEFAQRLTSQSEYRRLVLAVDAANEPALRIYTRSGFMRCDRRAVFLKIPGHHHLSSRGH